MTYIEHVFASMHAHNQWNMTNMQTMKKIKTYKVKNNYETLPNVRSHKHISIQNPANVYIPNR